MTPLRVGRMVEMPFADFEHRRKVWLASGRIVTSIYRPRYGAMLIWVPSRRLVYRATEEDLLNIRDRHPLTMDRGEICYIRFVEGGA